MNNQNPSFLMISGHDYRSKRQANIHFIARELAKIGKTRLFSIGFSHLSKIKQDPRLSLWALSNRVEAQGGVDCYLWRTLLHPVNLRGRVPLALERVWFKGYAWRAPEVLDRWICEATTIIIESGMGVLFFERIKRLNPRARVIYRASDSLETIGCSDVLKEALVRQASRFDRIVLPSLKLATDFPKGYDFVLVPHGMDLDFLQEDMPSPYAPGTTNFVSVGSMLFDASFFEMAAAEFPEITFHVIGAGSKADVLKAKNVKVYGEMPFKETLPYLRHARAGIAPYEGGKVSSYLIDTSMKLMQFEALGLPAICPHIAAGDRTGRFGYEPGDRGSIASAVRAALASKRLAPVKPLSWSEVTQTIIKP